jgi:hypothetical protein
MATINMKYARDGASKTNIIFDPVNGDQTKLNGTKLALEKNGVLLTGNDAFVELEKPIWGQDGNKTFKEILPTLTPAVPEWINSSDGHYPWFPFDPNDTSTWPTTLPDNGRGWECEALLDPPDPNRHQYYQNMTLESLPYWGALKIFQYRKQKMSDIETVPVYNDQFPIVEAQRLAEWTEYKQILFDTFTMLGTAVFPILYDDHYPIDLVANLIANTKLQMSIWDETHPPIETYETKPNPKYDPTQPISNTNQPTIRVKVKTSTGKEVNRWKNEADIRATEPRHHLLYRWFIMDANGVYQETPVIEGKYRQSFVYKPWLAASDINFIHWNGYVQRTILSVEKPGYWQNGLWVPPVPADRRVKLLLGIS